MNPIQGRSRMGKRRCTGWQFSKPPNSPPSTRPALREAAAPSVLPRRLRGKRFETGYSQSQWTSGWSRFCLGMSAVPTKLPWWQRALEFGHCPASLQVQNPTAAPVLWWAERKGKQQDQGSILL